MINSLLNTLLTVTITSTVLFLLVLLLRRVFKRQLTAALRCGLWMLVVLRLAIPFTVETEISPSMLLGQVFQVAEQAAAESPADTQTSADGTETLTTMNDSQVRFSGVPARTAGAEATATAADSPRNGSGGSLASTAGAETQPPTTDSPRNGSGHSPALALVLMWGLGVLAFCGAAARQYYKLRRFIRGCDNRVPTEMLELLRQCASDLGVKARFRVVLSPGAGAPCMTGIFKPVLILPCALAQSLGEEQLRHVFLHELTHFKRGDFIMLLIMNLLRAAHWFNPVAHILYPLWRADMETACDHTVLKAMGYQNRKAYVHTLIRISSGADLPMLSFAPGITDGKSSMKNRINGVYTQKKASRPFRVALIAMAGLLAFSVFTVGCQPTPETPPVVNKAEAAQASASAETQTPAEISSESAIDIWPAYEHRWQETLDPSDYTRVNIDASFDIPTQEWKTVGVKPYLLTQEDVDRLTEYFIGAGAQLYSTDYRTKDEIQSNIVDMKATLADSKNRSDGQPQDTEWIEEQIKELEAEYADAPDEPVSITVDTTLQYDEKDDCYSLDIQADIGNEFPADLFVFTDAEQQPWSSSMYHFHSGSGWYGWADEILKEYEDETGAQPPLNITEQQAKDQALKVLSDLGIEGFTVLWARLAVSTESDTQPKSENLGSLGYRVRLGRLVDGMVGTEHNVRPYFPEDGGDDRPIWIDETIDITLDNTGVNDFFYSSPGELLEQSGPVSIISAEQFKDAVRRNFEYAYASENIDNQLTQDMIDEGYSNMYTDINIERIELRMITLPKKDNIDEYELSPAFICMGNSLDYRDAERTQPESMQDPYDLWSRPYVVINALDGSLCQPVGEW